MDDLLTVRTKDKIKNSVTTKSEIYLCEVSLDKCTNNRIIADTYTGHGATFERREKTEIRIIQNGADCFCGSFDELVSVLRAEKERKLNQETY